MGVWGTGIFQDDTACDIRDEYRDLLGDGLSAEAAKAKILESYAGSFKDSDESGVAWLALAAAQCKVGRLDGETCSRAIHIVDSGGDLDKWKDNPKDFSKRKAVLEKLRVQLTSTQPAETKIRRRVLCECPWTTGDLIAYRLLSDRLVVFRMVDDRTDRGGTYPICEILDWIGTEIPTAVELKGKGTKPSRADYKHSIHRLMLVGLNRKWLKRIQPLDLNQTPLHSKILKSIKGKIATHKQPPSTVVHFKGLDKFLKEWFLLE
ncbi:MAG TPA: DUF4259 domain-containing protein [Terracidiphilus sp.]|nr:DUF4259 domain-containing protein [Terracidiphilus sp.]